LVRTNPPKYRYRYKKNGGKKEKVYSKICYVGCLDVGRQRVRVRQRERGQAGQQDSEHLSLILITNWPLWLSDWPAPVTDPALSLVARPPPVIDKGDLA
jgi:hypothetical protein